MTINPQIELDFNGTILPLEARLNPIKAEICLGYEYELFNNFRIEPYLGYLGHSFHVINEDELGTTFDFNTERGLTIGTNIFKYFITGRTLSIGGFFNLSYNLINFKKVQPSLDNNYFAFSFGSVFMGVSLLENSSQ